ncbi:31c50e77-d469-4145-8a43-cf808c0ddc73 [Thermothielavioides terrestris]|uniref:31c50e77-d469-4145-8a43-cf808c0ddc73 n=1 Tax=Thermothielavioides terrestris TaxID=2587410 RepID=A0A3S4AST6_9PEZI|nr:31c50e77-d469-4145-8a43-cf808c0ddc73 [Thermothielavioides terrestris]
MDSFKLLKRRTTELFQSLEQSLSSLPSLPSLPSLGGQGSSTMKGTWEKIQVPPLLRSSHSADIVDGNLYIFGGEVQPRRPVDNDMHVIKLPSSGAQADYYAIKAKPAKPSTHGQEPAIPTVGERETTPDPAGADKPAAPGEAPDDRHLSEVPLTTPSPGPSKGKGPSAPPRPELGDVPAPRVGHATAVIGPRIFLFGGRGGPDMTPLDEAGRVWVFDTRTHLWSFLDPAPAAAHLPRESAPYPAPRSYHCAVATPRPSPPTTTTHPAPSHPHPPKNPAETLRDWALGQPDPALGTPQNPVVGVLAERAVDRENLGYGTLLIHGGCLAGGARTADVWAFDVRSRVWRRLPDAPGAARGGAALALARSRLYRFGGFNGAAEEGGQLDFLELGLDVFDDQVVRGEAALTVGRGGRGGWQSLFFGKEDVGYKEVDPAELPLEAGAAAGTGAGAGREHRWPGNRSVAGFEAVTVGGGREYLVLLLGEREPSGQGHAAAGRFWDDVWAFQVPAEGGSLASVADTAFSVVGRSGEGRWMRVEMAPHDDEDDASAEGPGPRGWVATATMGQLEENGIVVWGGLNEGNRRLGDGWILRLG